VRPQKINKVVAEKGRRQFVSYGASFRLFPRMTTRGGEEKGRMRGEGKAEKQEDEVEKEDGERGQEASLIFL